METLGGPELFYKEVISAQCYIALDIETQEPGIANGMGCWGNSRLPLVMAIGLLLGRVGTHLVKLNAQ